MQSAQQLHYAIQFSLQSLWKHSIEILLSTALVCCLVALVRYQRTRQGKTSKTTAITHRVYKTTGKLLDFQSQMPCETNAVYLTRFKYQGVQLYLLHIVYGLYSYFCDPINLFCLCICLGQFLTYREYRHALQLAVFTTLYVCSYLYGQIGNIREQSHINKKSATVVRRGVTTTVSLSNVRRGDFVRLSSIEDYIPADILLLNCRVLVSELNLTGENIVVTKDGLSLVLTSDLSDAQLTINHYTSTGLLTCGEQSVSYTRDNILFRGTKLAAAPAVYGVVIETGNDCEIYRMDYNTNKRPTELQCKITDTCTTNFILMVALAVSVGFIIYEQRGGDSSTSTTETPTVTEKYDIIRNINNVILFINTLIPLSLQFFYTVACVLLSRLLGNKHHVRFNPGGSQAFQCCPQHIVTDKTGTLTTGRMTLHKIVQCHPEYLEHNPDQRYIDKTGFTACHNEMTSDPMEVELQAYLVENYGPITKPTVIVQLPFQRALGCKLAITYDDESYCLHLQGIPEILYEYRYGHTISDYDALLGGAEDTDCAGDSYVRVLAYLSCFINHRTYMSLQPLFSSNDTTQLLDNLKTLFLASDYPLTFYVYRDYIVPHLTDSMTLLLERGIDITILTGDSLSSAKAVSNLVFGPDRPVKYLSGKEFENVCHQPLITLARPADGHAICVYRASPHNKQMYVDYLQCLKQNTGSQNTVMMVGDGPNDVSAIKQADIGVAVVGESETAQQVADIVITSWDQIPELLLDCRAEQVTIYNIVEWVLLKHMLTGCTLIGLLLISFFTTVRDPASPYLMALYNGVAFLLMLMYIHFPSSPSSKGALSDKIIVCMPGVITGLFLGAWIYTLPGEIESKIYIGVTVQFFLLTLKMFMFSRRLVFLIIGILAIVCASLLTDDIYGYTSATMVCSGIFYML